MSGINIDDKTLVRFFYKSKKNFMAEMQGKMKPEQMDQAIDMFFSPKRKKFTEQEKEERKRRILNQIQRINRDFGISKNLIKINQKSQDQVDLLVRESEFSKNRKDKLRIFLIELIRWRKYFESLTYEQLRAMEGIYWDVTVHALNGLTPLPSTLLGRWVSGDVPARKPADAFMNDIIAKIKNEDKKLLFMDAYYLDKTGKKYVLKKSITEEQKSEMRKIMNEISYCNKSGTKYIDFLKYLIAEKVVELKVQYSTLGKCKYYKINI
ncbi:MAG TPA: hypothetical protein PLD91_19130 [Spirochaetota bacterium]|nr:hypothetical protein [Spirochaetota bacterium]